MSTAETVVFITGANRGIGKAFVEAYLAHGAKKIYAGARNTNSLAALVALDPAKIVPIQIDTTNAEQVAAAAKLATDVNTLINNAGVATWGSLLENPTDLSSQDMTVNYFGTLATIRAFAPVIKANGGGSIANVLSVASLVGIPVGGAYSASKAALHSATQSLRGTLAKDGIKVFGVYPGPIDTDMAKSMEMEKTAPIEVANAVIAGIAAGDDYIFPDPVSKQVGDTYKSNPTALEAMFASFGQE